MELSVIIVNHNTRKLLKNCLSSIYATTKGLDFEIIVVDNDSHDGSQEMIRSQFADVNLIQNSLNAGFSHANNIGYAHSSGENLLFLNSDTIIQGTALQKMVLYLKANPGVGALGPKIIDSHGKPTRSYQRYLGIKKLFFGARCLKYTVEVKKHRMNYPNYNFESTQQIDWLSGACLALKRHVFEMIGKWDEGYFFFFEDMDLCYQVSRSGYGVFYYPEAVIVHLFGGSSNNTSHDLGRAKLDSMKYYFKKNFSVAHYWIVLFYLALMKPAN